jgi:hypothetical protein
MAEKGKGGGGELSFLVACLAAAFFFCGEANTQRGKQGSVEIEPMHVPRSKAFAGFGSAGGHSTLRGPRLDGIFARLAAPR